MPSREEVAYFGAGPAPLPTAVLERGSQAFLNFENTGLSLAEISHRSPTAEKIITETKQALVSLLEIPDNYDVLIMHGGGSGEFSAVVFNLVAVWVEQRRRRAMEELHGDEYAVLERIRREVRQDLKLDYLVTGSWSLKASQEAALLLGPLGKDLVNVAVDSRKSNEGKFGSIPDQSSWNLTKSTRTGEGSAFVYYVDNETVDGVEFPCYPKRLDKGDDLIPMVVADMSSNFLSRKVDISKHAVIFVSVLPARSLLYIFDTGDREERKRTLVSQTSPLSSSIRGFWTSFPHRRSFTLLAFGRRLLSLAGLLLRKTTHCLIQCRFSASGSPAKSCEICSKPTEPVSSKVRKSSPTPKLEFCMKFSMPMKIGKYIMLSLKSLLEVG